MVCFNYSWLIQSTYYILNIILCSKFLRSQSLVFPINKSGLSSDTAKHSNVLSLLENFSSYHLHSMQSCKWYSAIILHLDGGPILFLWLVYCSSIKAIFHKANFVFFASYLLIEWFYKTSMKPNHAKEKLISLP